MHQLDQLVAEPLHERHVLIRHRDEAGLDHRLVGAAPLAPGQLLVLATPGAHEVPSLVDDLPALLESYVDGVESVWVGIGSLATSDSAVSGLASSLGVPVVAPDGGVAAMPGAALYAGHAAGGTGWYSSGEFLGARFPVPEWESWLPAAPVEVDGVVASPAPCGLVVSAAPAFDVPVNQRFPKLVVGSPVPPPAAVAALLGGLPDRPIMVVPAVPDAASHIWQAEVAMRLSRDVVFSAGMQVRTRSGALSTVVPDASGNRLYRPFPLVLQQSAGGGDQRVLDIAAAPPGWEREGRRSYRHADGAVVADVVPSGLVLRAASDSSVDPAASAAPFDPEGWTLTLGTSGQVVGLPVLAAAEELLTVLPAGQRAVVRVRMAGVLDEESEKALDRWALSRRRKSVSAEEDVVRPGRGFVVAPPEPSAELSSGLSSGGSAGTRSRSVVPAFEPAVAGGGSGLGVRLEGPAPEVEVAGAGVPAGSGAGGPGPGGSGPGVAPMPPVPAGQRGRLESAGPRRGESPTAGPVPPGGSGTGASVPGPAVAEVQPTTPVVRPGIEPGGSRPAVGPVPPVTAAGGPAAATPPFVGVPPVASPSEVAPPVVPPSGGPRPVAPTPAAPPPGGPPSVAPSSVGSWPVAAGSGSGGRVGGEAAGMRPDGGSSGPAPSAGAPSALPLPVNPPLPANPPVPANPLPPVNPVPPVNPLPPANSVVAAPPVSVAGMPPIVTTSAAPVSTVSGPPEPARVAESGEVREEPVRREAVPVENSWPPVGDAARAPEQEVVPRNSSEVVPEPRVPAPVGKALVVPGRNSTAAEQARFTAAAAEYFSEALATVNAAMATWPSMRVDDSPGVKADYVAVCLFLGRGEGSARAINGALRGGQAGVLDGQVPCLMSGIRRLPTHRRAVLRQGKVNESLEHQSKPGTVLTEPGFLAGSVDLDVTAPGADLDVLIWPSSARRTSELMIGRPVDEAVFVAGARFKALAVRTAEDDDETEDDGSPQAPRVAVLYRELAPGETPTTTELDERDLAVLAKLDSVLARRHQGQLRLVEDPEVVARLTTSMVAWQQEAAAAVAS
jgi:hypothetical protein